MKYAPLTKTSRWRPYFHSCTDGDILIYILIDVKLGKKFNLSQLHTHTHIHTQNSGPEMCNSVHLWVIAKVNC